MVYYVHTSYALSGTVSTPYYGQYFQESVFYKKIHYEISLRVPDSIKNSTDIRLVLEMEFDLELDIKEKITISGPGSFKSEELDSEHQMYVKNISMVDIDRIRVMFYRSIESDDLRLWETKRNTGLRLSWYFQYSTFEEAMTYYQHGDFIRIANIIHEGHDVRRLWENVQYPRNILFLKRKSSNFPKCYKRWIGGILDRQYTRNLLKDLFKNYADVSLDPIYDDIEDGTLEEAGRLYYYLLHCPVNVEKGLEAKKFYDELIQKQSLKTIITTLGNL